MSVTINKKRVALTLGEDVVKDFEKLALEANLSKSALLTSWINEKRKV